MSYMAVWCSYIGLFIYSYGAALVTHGVDASLPDHALSVSDPPAYLDALAASSEAAELLDPNGLGAFWWIRNDV